MYPFFTIRYTLHLACFGTNCDFWLVKVGLRFNLTVTLVVTLAINLFGHIHDLH